MYFKYEYGVPVRIIVFAIFVALDACRLQNGFHGNLKESVMALFISVVSLNLCVLNAHHLYDRWPSDTTGWHRAILPTVMVSAVLRRSIPLPIIPRLVLIFSYHPAFAQ